jgi:hypothetical protein
MSGRDVELNAWYSVLGVYNTRYAICQLYIREAKEMRAPMHPIKKGRRTSSCGVLLSFCP